MFSLEPPFGEDSERKRNNSLTLMTDCHCSRHPQRFAYLASRRGNRFSRLTDRAPDPGCPAAGDPRPDYNHHCVSSSPLPSDLTTSSLSQVLTSFMQASPLHHHHVRPDLGAARRTGRGAWHALRAAGAQGPLSRHVGEADNDREEGRGGDRGCAGR